MKKERKYAIYQALTLTCCPKTGAWSQTQLFFSLANKAIALVSSGLTEVGSY